MIKTIVYKWDIIGIQVKQPSEEIKDKLLMYVEKNPQIDVVLSHTCPYKYLPREVFMKSINPLKVDYSTEFFFR